jgi:hypothetical protein
MSRQQDEADCIDQAVRSVDAAAFTGDAKPDFIKVSFRFR